MASIIRKGNIPFPPSGMGDARDQAYTIQGFFGPFVQIFRKRNLGHPTNVSDPKLSYQAVNIARFEPSDLTDPEGRPLALLEGPSERIAVSRRRAAMPFAEKNCDRHQIRFYHRGEFLLETELGPLRTRPGDFVVIPSNIIYRETPLTDENVILIFEVSAPVMLAEELWDSVGFVNNFIDWSELELPEPSDQDADTPTRVRVTFDDETHWLEYDFDPCKDVIGYLGDPVVYRMNVESVPGIGTSAGFLTPPSNAVLVGADKAFFFNVHGNHAAVATPPPRGSVGAPGHQNDYDEVWFNHASEFAPHADGDMWMHPRSIVHPGLKGPPEFPPNPVRTVVESKLNFDTRARLFWTAEAMAQFLPDPQRTVYESLYGGHMGVDPETALGRVKR